MFKKKFHSGSILVIGGAKSGKSSYALEVCERSEKKKIFLASGQAIDSEMESKIKRHKQERGSDWITIEEPLEIVKIIEKLDCESTVILFDCLTLWVNNLYMKYTDDRVAIENEIWKFIKQFESIKGMIVTVSNEVGSGIVPESKLARVYRDDVGSLNQSIARLSKKVIIVTAGIPLILKDE